MSCYLYFFARKGDTFITLGEYSRNSVMFGEFQGAPWERITKLNFNLIEQAKQTFSDDIEVERTNINQNKDRINALLNAGIGKEGNAELMYELDNENIRLQDEIKYRQNAINFLYFIRNVGENEGVDLYYGLECYNPIVEDISE